VAFSAAACTSDPPDDGSSPKGTGSTGTSSGSTPSCGKEGRTGETAGTSCGTCSAGQYCDTDGFNECKPGCTSDNNCGENETCVRTGTNAVGTCRSCSEAQPGTVDGGSTSGCVRNTEIDRRCGPGGKGYACSLDQEPEGDGSCTQSRLPGEWCCGGSGSAKPSDLCNRMTQLDEPVCAGKKAYDCPPDIEPEPLGCTVGVDGFTFCCD
jgi:hypothetical protein